MAYNPVFLSYAVIGRDFVRLYLDETKLTAEAGDHLASLGVSVCPYEEVYETAKNWGGQKILFSEAQSNYRLFQILSENGAQILNAPDPVLELKAVKNEVEISQTRTAHIRDGIIMVRFMKWLKETVKEGALTEASAMEHLDSMRREAIHSLGLSFNTIAGYGPHGAIVHYAVTPESDIPLEPRGLFLVDSGGQYLEGTTDITRTFALGPLTSEEKAHFALVLRCMLNLMYARFPEGADGHHLDVLARQPLWEQGLDFLHGTGHGVGHLLNVHEGPNRFSWKTGKSDPPVPLVPGMVTTDEPGLYITGKHGIRLENELLCREGQETDYGRFLCFESLTLAPIDLDAVDPALLNETDRQRLNAYHRRVYETLAPELSKEEQEWLESCTREI